MISVKATNKKKSHVDFSSDLFRDYDIFNNIGMADLALLATTLEKLK
jgi:hypothetical protein